MPIFDTPAPINATVELAVGEVRLVASDRTDTVVEVSPTNQADASDVKAAAETRVEYSNGELRVTGPKRNPLDLSKKTRSIAVTIELPTGSRVRGEVAMGDFHGTGTLGDSRFKTSAGHVRMEATGSLLAETSAGHVEVGHVAGDAEITTGTGRVSLGEVDGTGVVKNSNGPTTIRQAGGELRLRAANGDISVDRAVAEVDAESSLGDILVGVADSTSARLELNTKFGRVRNALADGLPRQRDTVDVRARTSFGDITVRGA
ncbi:DUF4097 family beta strand repeat-containing protein [Amycolatopsis sp. YIM 10]|uniref:DUF4097 family beta strand repeat-containing protein n=1 Tax=Amycolatopsis sp. YIM 10 TaxID=2653857 RepID=UPI0012902D2D|nr:DUF4097 family beta strand repeat-containing protein [Amycolatopsis sp. YIM 10]QFU92052.1 hypothetical protein YIM_34455 [Amycolatopsis sp. YIM 10]